MAPPHRILSKKMVVPPPRLAVRVWVSSEGGMVGGGRLGGIAVLLEFECWSVL